MSKETIRIGIAWRADTERNSYKNFVTVIKEAGGEPVLLDQVIDYDLDYKDGKIALIGVDKFDFLSQKYANIVKANKHHNSNAEEVLKGVDAVIFSGGEDISPTLIKEPERWHGNLYEKNYNATRDVSDYLLMSCCIEKNIKTVGICRGMQMLAVVSGASMIQDLRVFVKKQGLKYYYEHRNRKPLPGGYRDFNQHDIDITDKNSILYDIYKCDKLTKMPSWHHQAVRSVEGTKLKVTATAFGSGCEIIEGIERTDKTLILGAQFHPEAAVVKHLNKAENADNYTDRDTALKLFTYFLEKAYVVKTLD